MILSSSSNHQMSAVRIRRVRCADHPQPLGKSEDGPHSGPYKEPRANHVQRLTADHCGRFARSSASLHTSPTVDSRILRGKPAADWTSWVWPSSLQWPLSGTIGRGWGRDVRNHAVAAGGDDGRGLCRARGVLALARRPPERPWRRRTHARLDLRHAGARLARDAPGRREPGRSPAGNPARPGAGLCTRDGVPRRHRVWDHRAGRVAPRPLRRLLADHGALRRAEHLTGAAAPGAAEGRVRRGPTLGDRGLDGWAGSSRW